MPPLQVRSRGWTYAQIHSLLRYAQSPFCPIDISCVWRRAADSDGDDDESDDDLNRHLAMPIDRYINTYTHIRTGHHGRTTAVCATIVLKPSTTIARGLEHALARYDDLTLETCTHTHTHTHTHTRAIAPKRYRRKRVSACR